jgi:dCMP deaminase
LDIGAKYMPIADAVADLSKARTTRVGAVVMSPDRTIRATGYNGAPRGSMADERSDVRSDKPEKSYWIVHAELNAILSAAKCGTPLDGCTIVVTHQPCMGCATAIVQSGIRRVITRRPSGSFLENWSEHVVRSTALFKECQVELIYVD